MTDEPMVIPNVVSPDYAGVLRESLDAAGYHAFDLAQQGRYSFNDSYTEPELIDQLRQMAERIRGVQFTVEKTRWLRFVRGDYTLLLSDHVSRHPDNHTELTLDFSERATNEAEIVYVRGEQSVFIVPQWPGQCAIVDRPPGVLRYERYLTHKVGDSAVYRLRVTLAAAIRAAARSAAT